MTENYYEDSDTEDDEDVKTLLLQTIQILKSYDYYPCDSQAIQSYLEKFSPRHYYHCQVCNHKFMSHDPHNTICYECHASVIKKISTTVPKPRLQFLSTASHRSKKIRID